MFRILFVILVSLFAIVDVAHGDEEQADGDDAADSSEDVGGAQRASL